MTDSDSDFHVPESRIERVKYSIGTLWDEYGRTDSVLIGVFYNLLMVIAGTALYFTRTGLLAFVGVVLALLHGYPFLKWGAQQW